MMILFSQLVNYAIILLCGAIFGIGCFLMVFAIIGRRESEKNVEAHFDTVESQIKSMMKDRENPYMWSVEIVTTSYLPDDDKKEEIDELTKKKTELANALNEEDYIKAAQIRDEIKKMTKTTK